MHDDYWDDNTKEYGNWQDDDYHYAYGSNYIHGSSFSRGRKRKEKREMTSFDDGVNLVVKSTVYVFAWVVAFIMLFVYWPSGL